MWDFLCAKPELCAKRGHTLSLGGALSELSTSSIFLQGFFFRFWVTRLYGIELWTIGGYCFLLRPVRFLRFFGFYYTCFGWLKLLVYLTTKTKLIENLLSLIF